MAVEESRVGGRQRTTIFMEKETVKKKETRGGQSRGTAQGK